MEKYTLGKIFSSGGATLYKNPSDQTVIEKPTLEILSNQILDGQAIFRPTLCMPVL